MDSTILTGLNSAQREATTEYKGAALIVAGAGSGKTRVLTSRIAWMVEQGVRAGSILALTFTNKAASEMRERISIMVGSQARYIWMGTFHSIFSRILRHHADRLGFTENYTIYDTRASETVIAQTIKAMNLSTDEYKPREVLSRISMAKNNLVTAESYANHPDLLTKDREQRKPALAEVYRRYQAQCRANNAMDFDDILLYTNILFRDHADVLEQWQQRFHYILVDEYQDTNYSQYLIIRRLAAEHNNICVVGDDSQSIYAFRGARIENILKFRSDYPDAHLYKLEQNYRSTQSIVNAANSLIAHNDGRIPKTVFSERIVGDAVEVLHHFTDREEALRVADEIRAEGIKRDGAWNEIAILYRNNSQSRSIEEALMRAKIPYIVYKGHSFYEHTEIRDVLAYLRLVVNPRDNEALLRIINTPARGIGDTTTTRLQLMAQQQGISLWELLCNLPADHPDFRRPARALNEFRTMMESLMQERSAMELYEFGIEVITRSGYLNYLRSDNSPEGQSRLANVGELLNSMQADDAIPQLVEDEDTNIEELPPPTLEEWLANVALMTDADNDTDGGNRVTLMTVHAAKGLEYDVVFIVGVEESLFPSIMSTGSKEGIEEERRLFYVALTRAKERAVVSCARERFKWGKTESCRPSRFIREIDPRYIATPASISSPQSAVTPAAPRPSYPSRSPYPQRPATTPATPRAQFNSLRTPQTTTSPDASRTTATPSRTPVPPSTFAPSQRVEHPKFGAGTILAVDPTPADLRLVVEFDNPQHGTKTLLAKYANLSLITN